MKTTSEFIAAAEKVRRAGGHFFTFDGIEYRIHDEPDGSIRVESSYTVEQWAMEVAEAEAIRLAEQVRDGTITQDQADAYLREVEGLMRRPKPPA